MNLNHFINTFEEGSKKEVLNQIQSLLATEEKIFFHLLDQGKFKKNVEEVIDIDKNNPVMVATKITNDGRYITLFTDEKLAYDLKEEGFRVAYQTGVKAVEFASILKNIDGVTFQATTAYLSIEKEDVIKLLINS